MRPRSWSCRGDVPLVTGADLEAILEARREDDAAIALASVFAADPAELGRVVRSEFGTVERIVEARDATPEELAGNEINAGLYAFDAAWLRRRIAALAPSTATGELYLTDLVRLAREDGRIVTAVAFEDDGRFDGINDRSQLAAAEWSLRVRLNEAHMRNGVTMRDPSTVYLDWTVELGADVTLEPNVILRGATIVGDGSVIGAGSQLVDATIGPARPGLGERRRVVDRRGRGHASGRSATSARGASSGAAPRSATSPSSRTPASGRGSKQHHMSYLGDAEVGERVNIGAGAITANYDGTRKHPTTIGDGAFIGVDTMIVAPREIGDGRADRCRRRGHPRRAGRQAGGRRPGPDPRATHETGGPDAAPPEPAAGDAPA